MINTKHLLKVAALWVSIVYIVCYIGVAIYPPIRNLFMKYSLHADVNMTSNYLGIGYFISGLIIWNIVTFLGVWLFAYLFNVVKK
ncbi:MAG: hypothetical protein UT86_C0003G0104 [Candidatus Magasanikbacteria bacterium GW2011_GWC2_40_17]|uniref:Uncharacterized protein n=1 Tax=Candidatus Magasanikbacteria bacterium GW2011_GWA2_42_32 TaxID=1619039 RepID=A0A0G1A7I2_9BACT|nr:MAG: hypothetical protein UT86_C0003G0104 [Candidatus Magasanikbacteria bacterium GW2011_GWC2_40_17]KKS57007.1 MAG: hypothetical protein UV20_C0004G0103 [Candidatus Magasanikbacteria bacterium GW2011_GWA2_42_32]OGH85734.1 MAG: hypothetical protein A2294_03855 [Candidatus Magasanikbacteria bacterium RIFOXYB2_FULL_38_10]